MIDVLATLSADPVEAARVLKLSARQVGDIAANASLRTGPTLPAIDRYTGVVYDALDAGSLDHVARRWLGRHVLIHAAALGPVGALDKIPTYRLGATAAAARPAAAPPGLGRGGRRGAAGPSRVRSSSTCAPRRTSRSARSPSAIPSAYVRVVGAGEDGTVRALNHFNKAPRASLVRTLAQTRPTVRTLRGPAALGRDGGHRADPRARRGAAVAHRGVGAMAYAPAMTLTGGWARLARAGVFGGASLFLATAGHVVGGGTLPGAGLLVLTAIGLALLSVTLTGASAAVRGAAGLPWAWSSSCSTCSSTPPPRR